MSEPSVGEVLERCRAAYAGCRTYQDEGTVRAAMHQRGPDEVRRSVEQRCVTAFERPGRYRFDLRDPSNWDPLWNPYYVVWTTGDGSVWRWVEGQRSDSATSLDEFMTTTVALSRSSAHIVPTLLGLTSRWPAPLDDVERYELMGREDVDGTTCHRILEAESEDGERRTWFLDVESHLLRRLEETSRQTQERRREAMEKFQQLLAARGHGLSEQNRVILEQMQVAATAGTVIDMESTTTLHPLVDESIEPDRLRFDAPY